MSTITDRQAEAKAKQDQARKDHDRVCHLMAEVFGTEAGREVLAHLWKRFDVGGRVFLALDGREPNALRAAIRDGERAAVTYIFQSIRKVKPDEPTP